MPETGRTDGIADILYFFLMMFIVNSNDLERFISNKLGSILYYFGKKSILYLT